MEQYGHQGRYHVKKEIGKGSFGTVVLAEDILEGRIVALKKVPKASKDDNDLISLRKECEIQRGLNHPNIIRLLDSFETPEFMIIVTEYATGGELATEILRSGRGLPLNDVKKITCDLVSALKYLFDLRILHRDLKPQNILKGSDGRYKLCDFGFAKAMEISRLLLTSIKGTPLYMAPEIIKNGAYDQKAELWSLGCIVYEMLVGRPPMMATCIFDLVKMHREPINFNATVFSGECGGFVRGLLEKEDKRRMTLNAVISHPFISQHLNLETMTGGEYSLAKALSPSQELNRDIQVQAVQRKVVEYQMMLQKTQRKMEKAKELKKQLEMNPMMNPAPAPSNLNFRPQPGNTTNARTVCKTDTASATDDATNKMRNLQIERTTTKDEDSDSSCETLTSSSEGNSDEDCSRTVVHGSGNSAGVLNSSNANDASVEDDLFWKSGTLFSLHSLGSEDKPIESMEWIEFLDSQLKEILDKPSETVCEKHFLTMLIPPLRNHLANSDVIEKLVDVLSSPFTLDNLPDSVLTSLQTVYKDAKVLPNLLYACKVIIRRCGMEIGTFDLEKVVEALQDEDLLALSKCLSLVCFLVYLDRGFTIQLCDSLFVLSLFPALLLFLKLDGKNASFSVDTLAILCHLMRIIPLNYTIVEELFLGNCPISKNTEELWRLLEHFDPRIKAKALRLVTYLGISSVKARETFFTKNTALRIWKSATGLLDDPNPVHQEAGSFVLRNFKEISPNVIPPVIQPKYLIRRPKTNPAHAPISHSHETISNIPSNRNATSASAGV